MKRNLRRIALFVGGLAAFGALVLVGWELYVASADFDPSALERRPADSLRVLDVRGRLLAEHVNEDGQRQRWTPLDSMSPLVVEATVAVEDASFFEHDGVDERALVRAAATSLWAGRVVSGASTLTMQLARLLDLAPRGGVGAKLRQMAVARRIEGMLDKRTILEEYLNRAAYGAGTVGVEAASQRYFGKPSLHLSLAESALLAGLPQGPGVLNPLVAPDRARARQRHVLRRMWRTGRIDQRDYLRAIREPLMLDRAPPAQRALHFTTWLAARAPRGGEVRSTLDADLQSRAERAVQEHVRTLRAFGVTQAAVIVLDNETCGVRAMVGSTGYWSGPSGAVNGALALRQPGSTLKPFTYALALEQGATAATVLADTPAYYGAPRGALFTPRNYDGRYHGPVLLAEALVRSLNVPALRLADRVGVDTLLTRLRTLGIDSLTEPAEHYGLGLTLGNGEVTLLELAQAYAALPRGGLACRVRVDESAPTRTDGPRVFTEESVAQVTAMLSDEPLRRVVMGPGTPLLMNVPVAFKTGTSANWRDNWVVGYTAEHTVAIWAGDFGGHPTDRLTGAAGAGPLFASVVRALPADRSAPSLTSPRLHSHQVCAVSGHPAGPHCPTRRSVWLATELDEASPCAWHQPRAIDSRNGLLAGPHCPAEHTHHQTFLTLPAEYAAWQSASAAALPPPTAHSPLCPADGAVAGELVITYPRADEVFLVEPGYDPTTQTLPLAARASPPEPHLTWLVDGAEIAQVEWPYAAHWQLTPGTHRLEVMSGGRRSRPVVFEVR